MITPHAQLERRAVPHMLRGQSPLTPVWSIILGAAFTPRVSCDRCGDLLEDGEEYLCGFCVNYLECQEVCEEAGISFAG